MALTKSDIPELLLPGLRAEFNLAYRSSIDNSVVDKIATVINTTLPTQSYGLLGTPPPMTEFGDERKLSGISASKYAISDKVFEATLAIERRAIEDDQLDLIRLRVRELADRVVQHRHLLAVSLLAAGNSGNGIDGNPLLANRTLAGESYTNVASDALSGNALKAGIGAMATFSDEHGIPLGVMPDTLLVGPELMWDAMELVESPVVVIKAQANASTPYKNVFEGRMRVIVSPFLRGDDAGKWFLLDTQKAMRSIIVQQRSDVPVEFSALDSSNRSESAFMRDRYLYGVRGRYNVGFGMWQHVYAGGFDV